MHDLLPLLRGWRQRTSVGHGCWEITCKERRVCSKISDLWELLGILFGKNGGKFIPKSSQRRSAVHSRSRTSVTGGSLKGHSTPHVPSDSRDSTLRDPLSAWGPWYLVCHGLCATGVNPSYGELSGWRGGGGCTSDKRDHNDTTATLRQYQSTTGREAVKARRLADTVGGTGRRPCAPAHNRPACSTHRQQAAFGQREGHFGQCPPI